MTMINVLMIKATGETRLQEMEHDDLRGMQRLLGGGYLEPIGLGKGVTMLVDEDGGSKALPVNLLATRLVATVAGRWATRALLGDALVLATQQGGDWTSCPEWILEAMASVR